MFQVPKSYLIDTVLKAGMGYTVVHESRGPNVAIREARVYSMPQRGRVEYVYTKSERIVRVYEDQDDLDAQTGRPKIKNRILVANQFLTFVVELRNKTDILLETDFKDFYRNLPKFIYDGQTVANYKDDQKAGVQHDTKGNKIRVVPGAYTFNDNKLYGEHPHVVFIEVEFQGGIYLVPDPVDSRRLYAGSQVKIDQTSIP
jgi:hypothetical protein